MKKDLISRELNRAGAAKTPKEKVAILHEIANPSILQLLRLAIDPNITWALPEGGDVPYKPNEEVDENSPGLLYQEVRRMYLFIQGGHPTLKQTRREQLFVELLQSVPPDDAKLLCLLKDKKLPAGLTANVIRKAFPEIY